MLKGVIFAERYRLEDFIGQGGMSMVYRAVDIRTGHNVAIKILKSEFNSDKEFLERFQREAQAASMMNHHNLVNLLDVGVEGEYRYLVLEYVKGTTLKEIIRKKGRLNYQAAIQIAIRILSALQHAHENGIIHRDIKPQNVLISDDGHVKVADFGIARMANAFTIGKSDTVVGSVHYSSPEQASGGLVEKTSDLYSTGVVLYEMLTGRVPFVGDTPVAVAMQHVQEPPPPIEYFAPETPSAVISVVMKAMRKKPADRYQSARDMAEALLAAKDGIYYSDEFTHKEETEKPEESTDVPSTEPPPENVPPATQVPSGNHTHNHRLLQRLLIVAGALLVSLAILSLFLLLPALTGVDAPDIIDLPVDEARAMTESLGLTWKENSIHHDAIAAGLVIDQSPESNTPMKNGDVLVATVSLGPVGSTTVPDVQSLSYENAVAALKERGITNIVVVKMVSMQPVGTILSQDPLSGTDIEGDMSVELTISGGSVIVPSLTGKTREEADALLEAAGLSEGGVTYAEVPQEQVDRIVSQTPAADSTAILGAPVSLTIGILSQPYQTEITVMVPGSDTDRIMKVFLVRDGTEFLKFQGTVYAGSDVEKTVPLNASVSGNLPCRVYLDDELFDEFTVSLH